MSGSKPSALLARSDVRRFLSGQLVSEVGSRITREGLPIVAIVAVGSGAPQLALLAALSTLPSLLTGNALGRLVDNARRRPLLVGASFTRAALLAIVPLLYILHRLDFAAIAAVTALAATAGVLMAVARHAYLPFLVTRPRIEDGNQLMGAADAIGETAGPGIMGLLIQWVGAPFSIIFDAAANITAALSLLTIRVRENHPRAALSESSDEVTPPPEKIREVWERVARHPILRPLWLNAGVSAVFGGFFSTLYELYVLKTLHLSPLWLGVLITTGGMGSLLGTWLFGNARRRWSLSAVLASGYIVFAILNFAVPLAHGGLWVALAFLFVAQFGGDLFATTSHIAASTIEQQVTPDHWLGRVRGTFHAFSGGLEVLGALAAGPLALWLSVRGTLLIAAVGFLCAAPVLASSRLRAYHPEDDGLSQALWP